MKLNPKNVVLMAGGTAAASLTSFASQAHADTVTVQKGDTTWALAQKNNTTVAQIVKDNGLQNGGKLIYVGQTLNINAANNNQANSQPAVPQANSDQQQVQTQQPGQQPQTTDDTNNAQQVNQSAPVAATNGSDDTYISALSGNDAEAKAWIAAHESGGNYNAQNGQYIGKYQLSASYLNGDYSPANQERVADQYVAGRYGSWTNAQAFWEANGWY